MVGSKAQPEGQLEGSKGQLEESEAQAEVLGPARSGENEKFVTAGSPTVSEHQLDGSEG